MQANSWHELFHFQVMHVIFQRMGKNVKKSQEKAKYLKIWAKIYKIWNVLKKVIIACNKLLEKVLVILNLGSVEMKGKNTKTWIFQEWKKLLR